MNKKYGYDNFCVVHLESDIHYKLKIIAARRKMTLQKLTEEYVKTGIEKDGEKQAC